MLLSLLLKELLRTQTILYAVLKIQNKYKIFSTKLSELSTMPSEFSIMHSKYSMNDKYHYPSLLLKMYGTCPHTVYVDFSSSVKNNIGSSVWCSRTT